MDALALLAATVLLLITGVGGLRLLLSWRRHRYRLRLRTAMALFVVVSLTTYATLRFIVPIVAHRRAIDRIYGAGGNVLFHADYVADSRQLYSDASSNPWGDVMVVHARNNAEAAVVASQLKHVPEAEVLIIGAISDQGLIDICNGGTTAGIKIVNLMATPISGNGLASLDKFNHLQTLFINTCPIDDRALASLETLGGIRCLTLLEEGTTRSPDRFSPSVSNRSVE